METTSPMEKHDQVDVVSLTPDGATVVLTMVETRPWGSKGENLMDLQAKLGTYLDYVESGQLLEHYPTVKGKAIMFRLHWTYPPSDEANKLLDIVQRQYLAPMSITLESSELSGRG